MLPTDLTLPSPQFPFAEPLPSSDELPCSDDTPVDNEDQNFVPNLLLFLLEHYWKQRQDWFFAVDMGVYHTTGASPRIPIIPDGLLSLGVARRKPSGSRNSYVLWEEAYIPPIWVLEMVSHTPGGEYTEKLERYAKLGVLYYVIYNPRYWQRDGHAPLEIYKRVEGTYQLQSGEPYWMPEIGLGIGRCMLPADPLEREVLSWFDEQGDRYLNPEEQAQAQVEQAQAQVEQEQQKRQQLEAYLRSLGVDPNQLPE
ncbi:MAG: Uma2 family endonuclease [Synechococcales bacterium]|nr:Uma2 family endonuclease [Synechococcales bacterium]